MDAFYYYCHLAGPLKCDFYAPTPAAIEARLDNLLEDIRVNPIIAMAPPGSMGLPEMVFYSSVKRLISAALYRPISMFPSLARVLASLERGDGMPFIELVMAEGTRIPFSCDCEEPGVPGPVKSTSVDTNSAFKAIMCSDGDGKNDNVKDFEKYANFLLSRSKAAGAVNVLFKMNCAGWTIPAKWRFDGKSHSRANA